jgi:uncharacterized protein
VIHPDRELRYGNDTIGDGLFANRLIPMARFTWVHDDLDQVVDPQLDHRLPPTLAALLRKYSYVEPRGRVLCWDHARFRNHSCEPNCRSTGFDLEIAVKDIRPGQQLTDDYGSLNVDFEWAMLKEQPQIERAFRGEIPVPSCRVQALPASL